MDRRKSTALALMCLALTVGACATVPSTTSQTMTDAPLGTLKWRGETTFGPVRVIDGDTLEVAGARVDLVGIEAPELRQTCRSTGPIHVTTPCGEFARDMLRNMTRVGPVSCKVVGQDREGRRPLAFCAVQVDADSRWIEELEQPSASPQIQKAVEELNAAHARARGFRRTDPDLGIVNIDLGGGMVRSNLARWTPENIAHLPLPIQDAADYTPTTPVAESLAEIYGPAKETRDE